MHTFPHFCVAVIVVAAMMFTEMEGCPLPYFAKTLPTSAFDSLLLQQTDFLDYRNGNQLKGAVQSYMATGDRSPLDNVVRNQEIAWGSLSAVMGVILLCLLLWMIWKVGRLKITDGETFHSNKENSLSTPLASSLACLSFPLLLFAVFLGYSFSAAQSSFQIVACQISAIWEQWRYGDAQQWIGLEGIKQNIELSNSIVQGLTLINSSQIYSSYNTLTISKQNIGALHTLIDTIQMQSNILPTRNQWLNSLILPQNSSLFTPLSQYLTQMNSLSIAINSIQQLLSQIASSNSTLNQFNLTLSLMEMQLTQMQAGYTQFYEDFTTLLSLSILDLSFVLVPMLLILSFSALFMLRMIQHYYESLSLNMFTGLMVLTAVSSIISLCLVVQIVGLKVGVEGICLVAKDFQEANYENSGGQTMIGSCMQDGTMDLPYVNQPIAEAYAFLNNMQTLGGTSISDIYSFVPIISNITSTLSQIKAGQLQSINFSYQNSLLSNLNNYTMNNPFNQNCFLHHWEMGVAGCSAGQDQYSDIQLILNAGGTVIPSHPTKSICLIANSQLSQTLFIELYSPFSTKCPLTVSAIISESYAVFNAIAELYSQIDGIFTSILQMTSGIQTIATYHIKYSQTRIQEILNAIQLNSTQINNFKNGNNCSVIKDKIGNLVTFFCSSFQSKLYQCFLALTLNLITLACFLALLFLYVVELKSITKKLNSQQTPQRHSKNSLKHLQHLQLHQSTTVTRRRASISTNHLLMQTTRDPQHFEDGKEK